MDYKKRLSAWLPLSSVPFFGSFKDSKSAATREDTSTMNPGTEENNMLPVPDATLPYWRTEPHPLDNYRSTPSLPAKTDVLIIGTGLSGVATAYHLSNLPSPPSVVLLEARQTCSGATGRNGGHSKVRTRTMTSLIEKHGHEQAEEFATFAKSIIYAIKETVEKEGLDCEFEMRRSFDVYLDKEDAEKARLGFERNCREGYNWAKDVSFLDGRIAEKITSVRGAKAALSMPVCSLWPYKFVTQLLEKVLSKGNTSLQTTTPVLSVTEAKSADGNLINIVHTTRGFIVAGKVVFATNAYTAGLLPKYLNSIIPVKGTAAHLALPEGKPKVQPHLSNTYNIEFGHDKIDYFNPRPDGGIVLGGGKWLFEDNRKSWYNVIDDSTQIDPAKHYFDGYMQKNFLGWEESGCQTERVWTGIMGNTPDSLPHVGKVPGSKNQWLLAGFNGGGMAEIFLSAKGIAKMVHTDVEFEDNGAGIPSLFKTTEERLNAKTKV